MTIMKLEHLVKATSYMYLHQKISQFLHQQPHRMWLLKLLLEEYYQENKQLMFLSQSFQLNKVI